MKATNVLKKGASAVCLLGLMFFLLWIPAVRSNAAKATGTVRNAILNVRENPSTASSIVCKLSRGNSVTILSEKTGADGMKWYQVNFSHNGGTKEGYVRADLLTNVSGSISSSGSENTGADFTEDDEYLYVSASAVRVRDTASEKSKVVANLLKGDKVKQKKTKTGDDGKKWTKVSFTINDEKIYGYIRSDLLTAAGSSGDNGDSGQNEDGDIYLYVNVPAVRVRNTASTSSTVVANLLQGDKVRLKKVKKGDDGKEWTKVTFELGDSKIYGYIRSDMLSEKKPSENSGTNSGTDQTIQDGDEYRTIRVTSARVRDSATTSSAALTSLPQGTRVKVKSEKTGADGMKWTKISLMVNGEKEYGYIRSDLLSSSVSSGTNSYARTGRVRPAVINVREKATTSSGVAARLNQGTTVTIETETKGLMDGLKWYQISCTSDERTVKGYVRSDLLN